MNRILISDFLFFSVNLEQVYQNNLHRKIKLNSVDNKIWNLMAEKIAKKKKIKIRKAMKIVIKKKKNQINLGFKIKLKQNSV